jgi:DNA-binding MarR family transcriptional regulator
VNDVIIRSRIAAEELMATLGAVRRVARRAVRQSLSGDRLPPGQSELLRLTAANPGISVADAARELGLAPNSVSTLIGKLTASGLLARGRDEADGRTAVLTVTPAGTERIARWRDIRAEAAVRAMDRLSEADRQAIENALPALGRLARQMEEL